MSEELIDNREIIEKEIDTLYYHLDYGTSLEKIKELYIKFEYEIKGSSELLNIEQNILYYGFYVI